MLNFRKHFSSPTIVFTVIGFLVGPSISQATALIDLGLLGGDLETETRIDANGDIYGDSSVDRITTIDVQVSRIGVEYSGTTSTSIIPPREVTVETDLRAFALGEMKRDPSVEEIKFDGRTVEVIYKQKGHFLALVPISFSIRAIAHASGEVEVKYPWYSFFTLDNEEQIEAEINNAVSLGNSESKLGVVRAEGKSANQVFGPTESALVAHRMLEVLESNLKVMANTEASLE